MANVEDIKRRFSGERLLALAEREGLRVRGGRFECPNRCSDDPRGASVSTAESGGLWNCHRCGAGGSVVDLLAAARGLSVEDVVARVDELLGEVPSAPKAKPVRARMNGAQLWERLAPADPAGESYLRGCGLEAAVPSVRFNVGRSGDPVLDGWAAKGYRLSVPLRDSTGAVIDFQLRSVNPSVAGRDAKRSLCGERPKGTAFGRPDLARGGGRVYVAEGMRDTLALQAAGVVVVGAPGVGQLHHLAKIIPSRCEAVLCPQNDVQEQSQKAFAELGRVLRSRACTVRQVATPEAHKDPAEWLCAVGLEQFRQALESTAAVALEPEPVPSPAPGISSRFALTDLGNAERLVAWHGENLRFSKSHGWLAWDGGRWAPDETDEHHRSAKLTARRIYLEAAEAQDSEVRKALADWARKSESESKLRAMVNLAATEVGIPVRTADLDTDPWLLNTMNGTVDLRTASLRPHSPEDLITKLCPVKYSAGEKPERWTRFLEDVLPDAEVRAFVQRWVGYVLTGTVRDHVLLVFHGNGANGKSTFIETLGHVLGDYCVTANPELLIAKDGSAHPTERATLLGRRLAVCSETEFGRAIAESVVKALTGGDTISARRMHQDEFQFRPTHKLALVSNHRPRVRGSDLGIWRRIMLVPFDVTIPDGKRDTTLGDRLRGEASGILNWAIEGCLEWQRIGLNPPDAVRMATETYRAEEDHVGEFVGDCCILRTNARTPSRSLFAAYEKWCSTNGEKPLSQKGLASRLRERNLESVKSHGVKVWCGIGVLAEHDPSQPVSSGAVDRRLPPERDDDLLGLHERLQEMAERIRTPMQGS